MDPQDYKIINVPMGSTKEDIKAREAIISDVYRKWYEANPSKAAYNTDLRGYKRAIPIYYRNHETRCKIISFNISSAAIGFDSEKRLSSWRTCATESWHQEPK